MAAERREIYDARERMKATSAVVGATGEGWRDWKIVIEGFSDADVSLQVASVSNLGFSPILLVRLLSLVVVRRTLL